MDRSPLLDLIDLKATLYKAAQFLYDEDGKPYLDRIVTTAANKDNGHASKIPNQLPKLDISEALADYQAFEEDNVAIHNACQTDDFKTFLDRNGIKALSEFHNGTTARTFLGWVDDNHVKVIRIPTPHRIRPDSFNTHRLDTPIMVQPLDRFKVGRYDIEVLPFIHVLPNIGLNAVDSLPGHSNIEFGQYVFSGQGADGITFDAHECFGLDREMLTYTALLRTVGYKMEAGPRDIGVTANGSPLFVDPGTLDPMASFMRDIAFNRLNSGLKELGADGLFSWIKQSQTSAPVSPRRRADALVL